MAEPNREFVKLHPDGKVPSWLPSREDLAVNKLWKQSLDVSFVALLANLAAKEHRLHLYCS